MNRRWILGGIAVVALAAFIGWIAQNSYWDEVSAPTFPRGEAARNPFYAAQRFVEELGATSEWRRALGPLPSPDAVLMLTHWNWDLIESRREQLERWVESGGRLLVDSTIVGGTDAFDQWSGLTNEWPEEEEYEEDLETDRAFTPPEPCREFATRAGAKILFRVCNRHLRLVERRTRSRLGTRRQRRVSGAARANRRRQRDLDPRHTVR